MTTPVIPAGVIQQEPSFGEQLGKAIEPFLAALKERREQEQRQQMLLIQRGQLALQEEAAAVERKEKAEQKKGREELAAGIMQELGRLQQPGAWAQKIHGAIESGDPRLMTAVIEEASVANEKERLDAVFQKYDALAKQQGKLTLEQAADRYDEMAAAAPSNPNQGPWTNAANTLRAGMRPKNETWRQVDEVQPDGKLKRVFYNLTTGRKVTSSGEVSTPYTSLVRAQGTTAQQNKVGAAEQMRLAFDTIWGNGKDVVGVVNEEPNIEKEVAPFLAKLELAGNLSIPIVGNTAETALRQYGYQDLSPAAQVYLTAIFNWRAAKVFADGGKALTTTEIREAARGFMPVIDEDERSKALKRENMFQQTSAVESGAGPALEKARREREQKRPRGPGSGRVPASPTPSLDAALESAAAALRARIGTRTDSARSRP